MGAFSDKNGVFSSNGYKVIYNNERIMFKNNSARNLFSQSTYAPNGKGSSGSPIIEDPVIPNYINDISYLYFLSNGGDEYTYPTFSENVTNASHLFAYRTNGSLAGNFNPSEGREGMRYPNSLINAAGMFKYAYLGYPILCNFVRNCPPNIIDMNNTFHHAGGYNNSWCPIKDENNNYILDSYENLFDMWHRFGSLDCYTSNISYYLNYYYPNNEDKRFFNSMVPDSVLYMNGTFALTSIGVDNYTLGSNNDIEFHLSNNLKDASFCFFNTGYVNNFRFTLPDTLTEANYMFAASYGYNFPNQVRFGNGLRNAVGMFAQLAWGYGNLLSQQEFDSRFPTGLPNTIINASKMFSGCNVGVRINIPRSVEDASFFLCCGGFSGYYAGEWNNNDYIIPNTVKNISFAFANVNIAPNNNYMWNFFQNYTYNPMQTSFYSCSRYNNTHFIFEEGSQLESLQGMLLGCNLNRPLEIPNTVKDISFLLCSGGTNYANLGGEAFFNNVLKENVENAAWAFCYGYVNDEEELNIYMPTNLKNACGMFSNLYGSNWQASINKVKFIGLENTQIEDAAWFLNGSGRWNAPVNFPSTVKNLYRTFNSCILFTGQYDDWTFNLEKYSNLECCDYLFGNCSNFNTPVVFPNNITSLEGVFYGCSNFDQVVQLPLNIVSTNNLFSGCSNFNYGGLPLDFSMYTKLVNMENTFNGCSNLNKIVNEETLRWPPHVEKISGIFNGCPNIQIETFVIPGSIKEGKNILNGSTIQNGILIQEGFGYLGSPYLNIKGKDIGDDGNYYINSIIIECNNGNIYSAGGSQPTFYNTNVNDIIFKNGDINFWQPNNYFNQYTQTWTNAVNEANFNIYNSNKFNGNIIFYNVNEIHGESGGFRIEKCDNFNQPLSLPPITFNIYSYRNLMHQAGVKYYLVLGEWPNILTESYSYIGVPANYVILIDNGFNELSSNWSYKGSLIYRFEENNSEFKNQLNNLIKSPSDLTNLWNDRKEYPSSYYINGRNDIPYYAVNSLLLTCNNFNSLISFSYGTTSLQNVVYNCLRFNNSISIPSTVTKINHLIYNCHNFNAPLIIPGSVEYADYIFSQCNNLNTAPLVGDGVLSLKGLFAGAKNFNQKFYFPNTLQFAPSIFSGCTKYNQETDFKNTENIAGAFVNCSAYNSNINFSYIEKTRDIRGFLWSNGISSIFNKEIDFNCLSVTDASGAFDDCRILNSNIKNCNLFITNMSSYFNGYWYLFNTYGYQEYNKELFSVLDSVGYNIFYYNNFWDAKTNNNFYSYHNSYSTVEANDMFRNCYYFNPAIVPNFVGASSLNRTFEHCYNFNQPLNVIHATDINSCFNDCSNFNQPLIFGSTIWSMRNAFENCKRLTYIPKFLNGLSVLSGTASYYDGNHDARGSGAFRNCYYLGESQQGNEEYTFHFSTLGRAYNSQRTTWCEGHSFFENCYRLDVPIVFERCENLRSFPDNFLENCSNFNSNIIISNVNGWCGTYIKKEDFENFSTNFNYEIIEDTWDNDYYILKYTDFLYASYFGEASHFISGAANYNRFFDIRDLNNTPKHLYVAVFENSDSSVGIGGFYANLPNFNYPIQQHFIPLTSDFAKVNYRNYDRSSGIHNCFNRTSFSNWFITGCNNFNQPILNYFFDSPESLALNVKWWTYGTRMVGFPWCENFNQRLIGNFTEKGGIGSYWDGVDYRLSFPGCVTPEDISINYITIKGDNGDERNYNADRYYFEGNGLKAPILSTHRNVYFNVIYNVADSTKQQNQCNIGFYFTGQSVNYAVDSEYYENFVPEHLYVDMVTSINSDVQINFSSTAIRYCNYYPGFNNIRVQNNQTIKSIQFFPSRTNLYYTKGFENSNNKHPMYNGYLLSYIDCGHIDLWNTFLGGRNGNITYNTVNILFSNLINVTQDFHFEETSNVYFSNVNYIFDFRGDCAVNIYINSNKAFNNVKYLVSTPAFTYNYSTGEPIGPGNNCSVNVFIKGGLTFYNTSFLFSNLPYMTGTNYYIGDGTVFYNCNSIPLRISSNLNLAQFPGATGCNFSGGRYNFNGDLDLSTISLTTANLSNALFKGGNNIIVNPSTYQLSGIRGCRNFVVNRYYSGSTAINNLLNRQPWTTTLEKSQSWEYIDSTNTVANLYVKSGTSLGTYLKQNVYRAFDQMFWNASSNFPYTTDNDWDAGIVSIEQETSDRITYCVNTYVRYEYETPWGNSYTEYENKMLVYYNIIFY